MAMSKQLLVCFHHEHDNWNNIPQAIYTLDINIGTHEQVVELFHGFKHECNL